MKCPECGKKWVSICRTCLWNSACEAQYEEPTVYGCAEYEKKVKKLKSHLGTRPNLPEVEDVR